LNINVDEINIKQFFGIVLARKYFIISCTLLMVVAVGIYTLKMKPMYVGEVKLLIERSTPKAIDVERVMNFESDWRNFYKTQFELLKSRSLAKSVIQKLHLENSEMFEAAEPGLFDFSVIITWLKSITRDSAEHPAAEVKSDPYTWMVNSFLGNLEIAPIRKSRLVSVRFTSHSPKIAADTANTVAKLYILKNIELRSSMESGAGDWLSEQLPEIKRTLDASKKTLLQFKERNNLIELDDKRGIASQKIV